MPVPDDRLWTVRFWARGSGKLVASAYNVLPDKWDLLPTNWPFDLTEGWQQRVWEEFRDRFPHPALLFYINHLAWALAKSAPLFTPEKPGQ